jgi:hypothetical protein
MRSARRRVVVRQLRESKLRNCAQGGGSVHHGDFIVEALAVDALMIVRDGGRERPHDICGTRFAVLDHVIRYDFRHAADFGADDQQSTAGGLQDGDAESLSQAAVEVDVPPAQHVAHVAVLHLPPPKCYKNTLMERDGARDQAARRGRAAGGAPPSPQD